MCKFYARIYTRIYTQIYTRIFVRIICEFHFHIYGMTIYGDKIMVALWRWNFYLTLWE